VHDALEEFDGIINRSCFLFVLDRTRKRTFTLRGVRTATRSGIHSIVLDNIRDVAINNHNNNNNRRFRMGSADSGAAGGGEWGERTAPRRARIRSDRKKVIYIFKNLFFLLET